MSFHIVKKTIKVIAEAFGVVHDSVYAAALILLIILAFIAIPAGLFQKIVKVEHPFFATFALYIVIALVVLFVIRRRKTHNQSMKADEK
jgi:hypothetical protein